MGKETLENKFIGSMLGTFVGDALGMPIEEMSRKEIETKVGKLKDTLEVRLAGSDLSCQRYFL